MPPRSEEMVASREVAVVPWHSLVWKSILDVASNDHRLSWKDLVAWEDTSVVVVVVDGSVPCWVSSCPHGKHSVAWVDDIPKAVEVVDTCHSLPIDEMESTAPWY